MIPTLAALAIVAPFLAAAVGLLLGRVLAPGTVVVKHSPARPAADGADPFAQEAASCQLFTALRREHRPGPELIACDPAALARDIAFFAARGYALGALRAFDAFPMTHHMECVALFTR